MKNMRTWRKLYNKALAEKDYDFIDSEIMSCIWEIKSNCKAYEKYAKELGYNDPLLADEQLGLSITFAHEWLFGNQI